jgi:GT2 family glycosyltransferase
MTAIDDTAEKNAIGEPVSPTQGADAVGSDVSMSDRRRTASSVGLPGVSLVLPTRNRIPMVRAAVRSILAGEVLPDEIIVVDQSEPPLSKELLDLGPSTSGCDVRIETCRPGLSRAVNHGALVARHDALVVVHDDVLVDADWLHTLISALAERGEASVVTGRVGASDPERPGAFAPALRDDPEPAVYSGRVDRCVIRPMNIALWRRDHLAVGGYDERLGPGTVFPGGEDHDYSVRLLDAGLTVHYVPDARVRHRAWRDRRDYLPLRWAYGLAHGAFYARSYDPADRHIVGRAVSDVRRRLRLVPHALATEPRVGVGHLVFLAASVVGATRWLARYGMSTSVPQACARPSIAPVVDESARPRWSVMIPTYNCARFLGETLSSVLAQDDGEMQIQVVDDHSRADDPFEVVDRIGKGRVLTHRHDANRGNIATFNTCLALSRGRYVHILHGDDRVFPGFYDRLGTALDEHPECVAAICGHVLIDEDGAATRAMPVLSRTARVLDDALEQFLGGNLIQAPSIVVRREAYERIGGFDTRIGTYAEDWEMWTRLAALGPIWYEPEIHAGYRVRTGSISSHAGIRSIQDMSRVIAINRATVDGQLPPVVVRRRTRAARRWAAERTARKALRLVDSGRLHDAIVLMRAAVVTGPCAGVVLRVASIPWRDATRRLNAATQTRKSVDGGAR